MTTIETMAEWAASCSTGDLPVDVRERLQLRVLDSLGCAIGAIGHPPPAAIREFVLEDGDQGPCTLIGGGRAPADRATLHNGALVRYLDFMDSFIADGETCHPADNLAGVLSSAERAGATGLEFLTSLAVAYELQYRMTVGAPIMANGFDHTTQQAYSVAAGAAKALRLDTEGIADAMAIAGASGCALAVTRAVPVSQWKGLAAADTGARAVQAALLAARGIGGPRGIIEGPKGFDEALGKHLEADWTDRSLVHAGRSLIKRHNAEVHSQTTIEATLRLRPRITDISDIERVHVAVFRTAYDIIGGGSFGAKEVPATKEDADHNLRYLVATALLDGEVSPRQFLPAALARPEVHALLQRVAIDHDRTKTLRYPECMPAQVTLHLRNGLQYREKQEDYMELTYPAWEAVEQKFRRLSDGQAQPDLLDEIVNAVRGLPSLRVVQLTDLLGRIRSVPRAP